MAKAIYDYLFLKKLTLLNTLLCQHSGAKGISSERLRQELRLKSLEG